MKTKDASVSLVGLNLNMKPVLVEVERIWNIYQHEAVITAGTEAIKNNCFIHSLGSLHPFGRALDFRTRYFTDETVIIITQELKSSLGSDFDVIIHKSHIHIEYDPKH